MDRITELINGLSDKVTGLTGDIRGIKADIEDMKGSIDEVKNTVETLEQKVDVKIQAVKESITEEMDTKLAEAKEEIKTFLLSEMEDHLTKRLSDMGLSQITAKNAELEESMSNIQRILDKPFDPDRSVVVYGLGIKKDHTLDTTVQWLLETVLQVTVKPRHYEQTDSRNGKPGVIKIELANAFDKIAVLRAKRKCDEVEEAKDVRISSCDSHDARVSKINTRFILSRLPNAKDYMVTSHGVIRPKAKKDTDEKDDEAEKKDEAEGDGDAGSVNNDEIETPIPPAPSASVHVAKGDPGKKAPPKSTPKEPEPSRCGSGTGRGNNQDPKKQPNHNSGTSGNGGGDTATSRTRSGKK